MKSKKQALPAWNLNDLYSSMDDPKIKRDLKAIALDAMSFRRRYAGKLKKHAMKSSAFLKVLKEYESIWLKLVKPYTYASLLFSESATVKGRGAFLQQIRSELVQVQNLLAFFSPELLSLDMKRLKKLSADPKLSEYKNFTLQLIASKKHELPERDKQIFADLGLTGRSAFTRLYEEEFADRTYTFKKKELSSQEILDYLHNSDRALRKEAHRGFSAGLKEDSRRLTYITNTLAQDKSTRDRYHNFAEPEDSRHLDNQIERASVDMLAKTVRQSYRDVERYYSFKKELLGYRTMYDYDRYSPVLSRNSKIPWNKAREMVVDAFADFHPEFGRIAKLFFTKRWIDAKERPGKRGGAFCSFCTPDIHPYVFMNYSGSMRDVFTLAHELGHAVHAYLMGEQSYLNYDTPLTIAETASVFAELLLFKQMSERTRAPRARLSLYLHHIESIIATVHRQTSMFLFERDLHDARKKGELQVADVNALWRNRQEEMFRGSITLTPEYDYWWSYIPHFIHTPFYVYAYSFGQMLALGFLNKYEEQPEKFPERYRDFLRAGNSKSPRELLMPFKVNLKKPDIWRDGVKSFRKMIREAEKLSEEI